MIIRKFAVFEAVRYGFATMWQHIGLLSLAGFALWGVMQGIIILAGAGYLAVAQRVQELITKYGCSSLENCLAASGEFARQLGDIATGVGIATIALLIILGLVEVWLHRGYLRIGLDLHDDKTSSITRLFSSGPGVVFKTIIAGFLALVAVFVSLIPAIWFSSIYLGGYIVVTLLLALPSLFVATRLSLFVYFLVDNPDHIGIVESLTHSFAATRGNFLRLVAVAMIFGFITSLVEMAFPLLGSLAVYLVITPACVLTMVHIYRFLSRSDGLAHEQPRREYLD